ncbi:type IV secretion protein Rhs [Flavobacterium suaedae]|uniref:Type IV secretion protein Rhs n=1 Tax=Flavobacterium suaedae TaxID=1767027 RepID=A0ABQ1JZH2_9FLAO|nr:type VI secretion system tip protein VgrG [Flavobacterium suaedae]GGB79208.1 type IV secretion protein Rhs [Flavobacterium suaedae]
MAAPTIQYGDIATFDVKVEGSTIPSDISVHSINIEQKVNRISSAKLVILDGDADTQTFKASSSSTFVPGNKITIEVGYDTKNKTVFTGIITRQTVRIDALIGSALEVECKDEAVKMIVGRKSQSYEKQKDSDIISSVIGNYSGISSDVTATSETHPEQVQYYVTDWDFIMALAENNGLIITTLNNKVSVFKPDADTSPVVQVSYGDGLMEFNADLESITQLASTKANAWDYQTQEIISGEASNSYSGPGNLSSKKLSEVVGLSDYQLLTPASVDSDSLTTWSKAQQIKSEYAKIQGEAKFQGTNLVEPGKYITLGGLGDRFNGDYIISGVEHEIADGNWLTKVNLGLPQGWFIEQPDVVAPPASGLLPCTRGLFTGTVKKMYEDPDSQYRVQVNVPIVSGETSIWARLSNFYATSGAGSFFFPEVGDEVLLGFINEDPRFPVILGSLYSSSKIKPYEELDPNEKNSTKAIVSKSGIYVQFDDENKVFTISTPGNNKVTLSDQDKKITLEDENSNSITMSESGITIKSPKDISIEADQNIKLTGNMGINAQASSGDVQLKGLNIKQNADVQYSAEGSASASVQGGAELTLKGAMVMIN